MLFRGDSLSVLLMHSCIRLNSIFLFFLASGSRSRVRHLIALLFLVPPAAKEGKGDCEFPLCPPWILLLPLCNAGHCVPRGGYGIGLRSIELSISGGQFFDAGIAMVALLPCLDHARTALNLCRFLRVRDAYTEARGQRPNFRAHFNLWWARHGWLLIHPVSRQDGQFSRPPYFTAGVNLTAEQPSEPPRGGEHGAGAKWLYLKRPFAESRNEYRL